jgi:ATP-dependent exoDNAse (exonuclease V) beta subunit
MPVATGPIPATHERPGREPGIAVAWPPRWSGESDTKLAGSVVHRLFQSSRPTDDVKTLLARAVAMIRPEERVTVDASALADRAVKVYRRMSGQPDLADGLARGRTLFEVPFSLKLNAAERDRLGLSHVADGAVVRGAIDCVLVLDAEIVVLEFKTGRHHEAHSQQLAIYEEAARRLFPSRPVRGVLVYPEP